MVPAEKRAFAALVPTKSYEIQGIPVTARGIGHLALAERIAAYPLLADILLSGVSTGGKVDAAALAPHIGELLAKAPAAVVELLVMGHDLRPDEVEDFRAFVFATTADVIIDMAAAVVEVTMPNGYAPFVDPVLALVDRLRGAPKAEAA